jgi:hypothetical protein
MRSDRLNQLIQQYINKDKWWDVVTRFVDVLRINMFMVDAEGHMILPPEESRYGGRLLTDAGLGYDFVTSGRGVIQQFERHGHYLESANRYDLRSYALPITSLKDEPVAYLIIGPVILSARLELSRYHELAQELGTPADALLEAAMQIRVVSHLMMKSILDLLSEIIKDNIELNVKQKELEQMQSSQFSRNPKANRIVQEIFSTVRVDELLATMLDVAMKMTDAEGGSIMVLDEKQEVLNLKVSRGLDMDLVSPRQKMGEGVAGLVAQAGIPFIIDQDRSTPTNNRIQHLLKRPEIKKSVVIPLIVRDKIFGVMNLHTKQPDTLKMEESVDNLKYLSNLLSSTL